MRYHLHQKFAGRRLLDTVGFEADSEVQAVAHATSAYDDLQRLFGALISVELESAEGRSIMILTRSERVTSQA
ncbi:hypothetical protein GCM10007036_31170 [Alsobacter metallidurans]|uniref:Uncharacterized protein n=1 Tax=Alsobacter metallidurans TaxID=340221 RepID=A0A917I911_9HYPH|nr:hypothetical protein GCM10007036_31170 [Alsobacter metallidurans]